MIDLIAGDLLTPPGRGRPATAPGDGRLMGGQEADLPIVYEIDYDHHEVIVRRVDHRSDICRGT
ncbi:MAG: type II toxin-antitoxin system RelE/ParE family toxin [Acidimicrobiales bacterium]